MDLLLHFLQMGGYAAYVWSAYGLVLGGLALHLFLSWKRLQKLNNKQKTSPDE